MKRSQRAFTLIELLVTLSVAAIVLTMAVPAFTGFIKSHRVRSAAESLYGTLALARTEAIKRNAAVTVSAQDADWAQGWTVTAPGLGAPLLQQDALQDIAVSSSSSSIVYAPNGRPSSGGGASFSVCDAAATASVQARVVSLDPGGYVSIALGDGCS